MTRTAKQTDLFATTPVSHPYAELGENLWALASKGIYIGSSSWKYESWWDKGKGPVYVEEYTSKKDFEQNCLEEYAKTFPTVGGDFSFYNWPGHEMVERIAKQTPDGFKIALKCTEFITLKKFPNIGRWADKAGKVNPDFLNPALFADEFLARVEPLAKASKLAPIILEFTAFPKGAFADWTEFAIALEKFFEKLPRDIQFGVEIRSREFFHDAFLEALKAMGPNVAPIVNSWTRMTPLDEQWKSVTMLDFPFGECRAVMRPGRTRDEAQSLFDPYDRIRERVPPARRAFRAMIEWSIALKKPVYIFINNHLEGCAHQTIAELVEELSIAGS